MRPGLKHRVVFLRQTEFNLEFASCLSHLGGFLQPFHDRPGAPIGLYFDR
jgi:hypothetical protein